MALLAIEIIALLAMFDSESMRQHLSPKEINTSRKICKRDDGKFRHRCGNISCKHKGNFVKDRCGDNTRLSRLTNRGRIPILVSEGSTT